MQAVSKLCLGKSCVNVMIDDVSLKVEAAYDHIATVAIVAVIILEVVV